MAISDSSKVDLLYKKNFGLAKTEIPANKGLSGESTPSPALNRGDKIWVESASIPSTPPSSSTSQVFPVLGILRAELVPDTSVNTINGIYKTWKIPTGGNLNWISPEFGTGYQVEAYIAPTGTSDPKASGGIRIYQDGDSSGGEFYFDYIAGVLNFIGDTMPSTFQANPTWKIFLYGYTYIGGLGTSLLGSSNAMAQYDSNSNINAFAFKAIPQDTSPGYVQIRSGASSNNLASIYASSSGFGTTTYHTLPMATGQLIGSGDYGYPTNVGVANSLVLTTATGGITASGTLSGNQVTATTLVSAPNLGASNQITISGSTSGTSVLKAPAVAGSSTTITMPSTAGTLIGTGDSGTVSNTMLATVGVAKGGTGLTAVSAGNVLVGTGGASLGTQAFGSGSTASSIVQRDANQVINVSNVVQTGYNNNVGNASYTVPITCTYLEVSGTPNVIITLPTGTIGKTIWVRNNTSSAGIVTSASANIIQKTGGSPTSAILGGTTGAWAMLVYTGSAWQIMASGT